MAGDWIKVESCTPNKPEIMKLARLLGVTRDDAFGKAMRFWIWIDSISVDGRVDGAASQDVDALVGAQGFCSALAECGWIILDDEKHTFTIPNFDRHCSQSAKSRALKAKRQAKWRDASVDGGASTQTSPEKRREEKNKRELKFSPSDFQTAEEIWEDVRTLKGVKGRPDLTVWADTVRLMVERDKLTHEEILDMFRWAHKDTFWRPNIRSPAKLREKWEQLSVKRYDTKVGTTGKKTLAEKNREAIERWKAKKAQKV